ncbi:hypothetical protein V8E54_010766 [Elaphomyces granulatus]
MAQYSGLIDALGKLDVNDPAVSEEIIRFLEFNWSFSNPHDGEANSAKEINPRTLLDTYGNRDVIYSTAIARHIGRRWEHSPGSVAASQRPPAFHYR